METNVTKSPFLDGTDRWCDVTNKTSAAIKALWEGDVIHCSGFFFFDVRTAVCDLPSEGIGVNTEQRDSFCRFDNSVY